MSYDGSINKSLSFNGIDARFVVITADMPPGHSYNPAYQDAGLSEVRFYRTKTCADVLSEGYGLAADFNTDCYIDIYDLIEFAASWLRCVEPSDENCEHPWPQ